MITANEMVALTKATSSMKFLLNNHIQWHFADDYHLVFAKAYSRHNCPTKTIKMLGIAMLENREYNAKLFISYHEDLQQWSSVICFLDCDNNVTKSYDIISVKKIA